MAVVVDEVDDRPNRVGRVAGLGFGEPGVPQRFEVGATVWVQERLDERECRSDLFWALTSVSFA